MIEYIAPIEGFSLVAWLTNVGKPLSPDTIATCVDDATTSIGV